MQFPLWEVPVLGGGIIIAIIATVHVFIASFAVGAGILTAWLERKAIKTGDHLLIRFLKDYSLFLILGPFIFGALTGVGIWFSISLVSPESTSALIHQFVWGWATEWVFFLVEIVAGYVYYYTWDRMSPRYHNIVGWIYAISAFMSLVIINGILTFMLTPGGWLETGGFWHGFFNPTYWPSLALRTISALSLAAIFVTIVANLSKGYTRDERHRIITEGGKWLIPLALMAPVSIWYFAFVPEEARNMVEGGAIAMTLFFMFGLAASTLVGFYAYFGLVIKKRYINLETAILLGAIAFIATGAMEFVREGIRKPYLIYNYMYSNGILVEQEPELMTTGVLEWAPWTAVKAGVSSVDEMNKQQRGKALYDAQCTSCHTIEGVNGIVPLIRNWPRESVVDTLRTLHTEQYYMPPFIGPESDLQDLADYLMTLKNEPAQEESQRTAQNSVNNS